VLKLSYVDRKRHFVIMIKRYCKKKVKLPGRLKIEFIEIKNVS